MADSFNEAVQIDTKLLDCKVLEFSLLVTNGNPYDPDKTLDDFEKYIELQVEYGKISNDEINFTPYMSDFSGKPVNIHKKNLVARGEIDDGNIKINYFVQLHGICKDDTEQLIAEKVADSYGTHIIYGQLKETYKEFKFTIYTDEEYQKYINGEVVSIDYLTPVDQPYYFSPPVIKGDKFTLAFRCTTRGFITDDNK
jgi:hypothetical protein